MPPKKRGFFNFRRICSIFWWHWIWTDLNEQFPMVCLGCLENKYFPRHLIFHVGKILTKPSCIIIILNTVLSSFLHYKIYIHSCMYVPHTCMYVYIHVGSTGTTVCIHVYGLHVCILYSCIHVCRFYVLHTYMCTFISMSCTCSIWTMYVKLHVLVCM